ncbi:alpha-ketoacid dehydrogenase subunit beta [Haladaptatus halobius]|uniref:alpha-ketoacid dehydrogenase subunit beta n=1 Tax=Haladaptatus halobius TaxID=2884875 RepID=UPI001D0A878B|nr:transketolase C-terminal domain-containing protein [Haladaptatus halobius]
MPDKSYIASIIEGYHEALAEFDESFLIGEDIRHALMGTTRDLVEKFGEERVLDAPISEQGFHGLAVGAAMDGKRPIIEYQINTMSYLGMDQLVNNAQKLRHMTDGQVSIPMTITVNTSGVPGGSAQQHSDNAYPSLLNYGVKTVVPSTAYDQKGLFLSAVAEDDPVMVFWPASVIGQRSEVPEESYRIPLGKADVKREGEDVTVVAVGEMVPKALSVAGSMADEVSIEVIDPRTLLPLDEETIFESVRKTNRVVVVDSSNRTCGFASEVASRIANRGFWDLDAPIKRVTRADVPIAYDPPEEQYVIPDEDTIEQAVSDVVL